MSGPRLMPIEVTRSALVMFEWIFIIIVMTHDVGKTIALELCCVKEIIDTSMTNHHTLTRRLNELSCLQLRTKIKTIIFWRHSFIIQSSIKENFRIMTAHKVFRAKLSLPLHGLLTNQNHFEKENYFKALNFNYSFFRGELFK